MPIFRVKSVKIYTGQKKFTLTPSVASVTIIRYVQMLQVVQVLQVVKVVSFDDMHSENIWFAWSKPSDYGDKLRCHACD